MSLLYTCGKVVNRVLPVRQKARHYAFRAFCYPQPKKVRFAPKSGVDISQASV
jgi:hypothetical protein